jgi:hypothetical protein
MLIQLHVRMAAVLLPLLLMLMLMLMLLLLLLPLLLLLLHVRRLSRSWMRRSVLRQLQRRGRLGRGEVDVSWWRVHVWVTRETRRMLLVRLF